MFHTEFLARWLKEQFGFAELPAVALLRAYTNDVYRVDAGGNRFALKVYGIRWRADDEIRWEIDLLHHLAAHGVSVAGPVAGRDGDALRQVVLDGERRQVVLFEWADGGKPEGPFSPAMYRRQGKATATIHLAADGFTSPFARPALDLDYLVEHPVAFIESMPGNNEAKAILRFIAEALSAAITLRAQQGLDWGPCHGDLTFDNVHHTAEGQTVWYDFDSGGPGWRAIDLQGWAATMPDRQKDWRAFLDGYRTVRALSDNDVVVAPYLFLAQEFWSIQVDLQRRVIADGPEAISHLLKERCNEIASRARALELATG